MKSSLCVLILLMVPQLAIGQTGSSDSNRSLSLFISTGINRTYLNETQLFYPSEIGLNKKYNPKSGLQTCIGVSKSLSNKVALSFGGKLFSNEFQTKSMNDAEARTSVTENATFIGFPLSIQLTPFNSKIQPYISFGGEYDILLNSKMSGTHQGGTIVKIDSEDITDTRNPNNFSLLMGIGLKLPLSNGAFFIGANYKLGLVEFVRPEKRYSNPQIIYDLQHADPDFKLNSLEFNFGYLFTL